jgi:hypothetical protein
MDVTLNVGSVNCGTLAVVIAVLSAGMAVAWGLLCNRMRRELWRWLLRRWRP